MLMLRDPIFAGLSTIQSLLRISPAPVADSLPWGQFLHLGVWKKKLWAPKIKHLGKFYRVWGFLFFNIYIYIYTNIYIFIWLCISIYMHKVGLRVVDIGVYILRRPFYGGIPIHIHQVVFNIMVKSCSYWRLHTLNIFH